MRFNKAEVLHVLDADGQSRFDADEESVLVVSKSFEGINGGLKAN